MKIQVAGVALVVLVTILFMQSGVTDALIAFMLVGAVPGTLYSLSPVTMLLIIAVLAWALALRSTVVPLIKHMRINKMAQKYLERKNRLPKRRFGRI